MEKFNVYEKNSLLSAFVLNLIILAFEAVGLILSVQRHGIFALMFYTEISNYFALVVSLIFCIFCVFSFSKNYQFPRWIISLRFISTVCLVITFLVSFLIIIPFKPSMFSYMLYEGSSLYHHVLCPILSVVAFLFVEPQLKLTKSEILLPLIPTSIYGIVMVVLNLLRVIEGPYPFFYFYQLHWFFCVFILLSIALICLSMSFLMLKTHNLINDAHNKDKISTTDQH